MKIFKYSLISVALFLLIAVGFFLYSVSQLPDPIALKEKIKTEKEVKSPTELQKEISAEVESLSQTLEPENESVQQPTHVAATKSNTSEQVFGLINEEYSDIRVCENLGKPSTKDITPNVIFDAIASKDRNDSKLESFRVPIKHIFQSKPMKELFAEIDEVDKDNLQGEERTSYLKKIGFYAIAVKKAQEAYSQKAEYEEIGDRAYDLYVISQIVEKKPELALDKNVLDFCNQLQTSIGQKSKSDITEERKELLKLIEYAGLTPQQLDFNPQVRTKFNIDLSKTGLSFGLTHPGMKFQ
ncbi:MAG: hypothetical protein V4596_11570 [Bdellovibrionota bacterium]